MAVYFGVYLGTGRARCKLCKEKIKTDEVQVNASGYRTSGNAHLKCLNGLGSTAEKFNNGMY